MTDSQATPAADAGANEKPKRRAKRAATATFAACMKAAQEQIKNIPKNGKNSFHDYNYTTAEDMIGACRFALHANGLIAERTGWSLRVEPSVTMALTKQGNVIAGACVIVVSRMRITHVDSDEMHEDSTEYPAIPEKGRPLDKAISGALSTSLSYWWRDTLQVPRCDYEVDIGQTGQYDDAKSEPEPAPPPATLSPPRAQSTSGGRTGSRTPNAASRIISHYTNKLRAAIQHGESAVQEVAKSIRLDASVAKGTPQSIQLYDEYKRCMADAKAPPPPNDDEAERQAIAGENW